MFHNTFSSSLKSYCLCSKLVASPFSLSVTTYISSVQYNLSSFSQTWSNLAHSNYSISFDPSSCRNNPSPRLAKNYWPISNNRWKCIGRSIFLFFCVLFASHCFFFLCLLPHLQFLHFFSVSDLFLSMWPHGPHRFISLFFQYWLHVMTQKQQETRFKVGTCRGV